MKQVQVKPDITAAMAYACTSTFGKNLGCAVKRENLALTSQLQANDTAAYFIRMKSIASHIAAHTFSSDKQSIAIAMDEVERLARYESSTAIPRLH
jgi:hypothetical protein